MVRIIEAHSYQETEKIGEELAKASQPGQVYALDGDLGTGKTVLARGFARGMGIQEDIASPTFTIVHEYTDQQTPLFHFDIYRLPDPDALWDIGWDDYLERGGVCLVEWASQLKSEMPEDTIWIQIEKDLSQGTDYRRITITQNE